MNQKETMLEYLKRSAQYAINSKSRNLVYQVYGESCMAYRLKAITFQEYMEMNTILVRDTLNNGRLMNEWDREGRRR